MNLLMAGMVPAVMALKAHIESASDPTRPEFWFVMSMGLLVGFVIAYPMNWWLVANRLKHGMMTVRRAKAVASAPSHDAYVAGTRAHGAAHSGMGGAPGAGPPRPMAADKAPRPPVPVMTALSFLALAAGVMFAFLARPL
jgi:hypothetical protein